MASSTSSVRILFVDDDAAMRRTFARTLKRRDFEVDAAESGLEALRMAGNRYYPIVVTDLRMPGLDGMGLIDRLRRTQPNTAFVILTGLPEIDLPQSGGGDDTIVSVLEKPWDEDEMVATLHRAVELHRHRHHGESDQPADPSVLLIEDEPGDADLVAEYLSEAGKYRITHVQRLDEALRHLHERPVDVVLTDLSLPDARGLDCVTRIQKAARESAIIVLSGLDDEQLALQAVQLGAQDYLTKGQVSAQLLHRSLRYARERKRAEQRLAQLAHYDQLTGLANRVTFRDRLDHALARSRRQAGSFAVMFLDLDHFKSVNDTLGHDAGDALLQQVSERLQRCVREYDTVARLGGDEFAILLEDLSDRQIPIRIAQRISEGFCTPFRLCEKDVVTTTSIGIAEYPRDAETSDELLKCADVAMYRSKKGGRNTYSTFPPANAHQALRLDFERQLREAVDGNGYVLHYQPQLELRNDRVRGAEALLRLRRADGSVALPSEFVPILEDTGLIVDVGAWVLLSACERAAQWHRDGHDEMIVTVNLSARQFERPGLVHTVEQALETSKLKASCLELEITESLLMRDTNATNAALATLKELGVRIAIDDFGTGYSSLAYLDRFDVDVLKIDQSFVSGITGEGSRSSIASAVVGLGHKLGLEVIAEGVESSEQLRFLKNEGCDVVQGYLVGKPAEAWAPPGTDWRYEQAAAGNF